MVWLWGFGLMFGFVVVMLIRAVRRAGPRQLSEGALARTRPVARVTVDAPGEGWQELGSRTEADGLNLRFDADDDPQAEAWLPVPGVDRGRRGNLFSNTVTVTLAPAYETVQVHTGGYAFRVRLRGTGPVVGRQVQLKMKIDGRYQPCAGGIENDDDTDAAVGGWIEVEWAEVLALPPGAR